jgi:1-acyl-sn-glycerol-3-phosphate acyltransferase
MSLWKDPEVVERVDRLEIPFDIHGMDPYGIAKKDLVLWFSMMTWFYRHYFSVQVTDVGNVPPRGRAMLVGNHSGGLALDGAVVALSMLLEAEPPRLAQAMADKFLARMPFVSLWTSRTGQFTGLPEHAERLLRDERLLMVFPEGSRGTAKLYWERNSLVRFGTGFMRLAMETGTPIIPFAFAGGGEAIPTIRNLYGLGKLVGAPYVPITPYLLPIPRPVKLQLRYGSALRFAGTGREDDPIIEANVERVKTTIADLLGSLEDEA